jgi:hypothetical protein
MQRHPAIQSAMLSGSLEGVPGFYQSNGWRLAGPAGILIPYQRPDGRIQGFQVRCDDPSRGKYLWLSSGGYPGGTPSGTFAHYTHNQPRLDVWLVEGGLKAAIAAHHTDEAFIGLAGCHINSVTILLEPLPLIPRIILAPDADWRTNPTVRRAWEQNADKLKAAGVSVCLATWEPGAGKGIDDFILKKGRLPSFTSC